MAVTFQLKDLSPQNGGDGVVRASFKEALRDFYARMAEVMERGNLVQQWWETAVWIDVVDAEVGLEGPIYFYEARDIGVKYGLVTDGSTVVNDGGQEPDHDTLVEIALICAVEGNAEEYIAAHERAA